MKFTEIVVKVSGICNLNCNYCYVFNKGDLSFKNDPPLMSIELAQIILEKIDSYCRRNAIESLLIIFHGGEPLLAGQQFYKKFIQLANQLVTSTKLRYTLQTNGP